MTNNKDEKLFTLCLLLGVMTLSTQTTKLYEIEKQEQYKNEVHAELALDYSMHDYSVSKRAPKVMGTRLAKMVEYICRNYQQQVNLAVLTMLQSEQINNYTMPKSGNYYLKKRRSMVKS